MGLARFLFLGDIGQQLDLDVHKAELERLREQSTHQRRAFERADHQLDALQQENNELKVSLAAVVRILAAKGILTDRDVRSVVALTERH